MACLSTSLMLLAFMASSFFLPDVGFFGLDVVPRAVCKWYKSRYTALQQGVNAGCGRVHLGDGEDSELFPELGSVEYWD